MISVLIVDDDKLVRKGLVAALPWKDFNMQVVGEASNGRSALEYIENHEVDIVLLDLAMPIMSGMELMRILNSQYPAIKVVILTMHKDFDYIQDALRMGALDYMVKSQVEHERFDGILSRIQRRYYNSINGGGPNIDTYTETDHVYAFFVSEGTASRDITCVNGIDGIYELSKQIFLYEAVENEDMCERIQRIAHTKGIMIVKLLDLAGFRKSKLICLLVNYYSQGFFYDYSEGGSILYKSVLHLENQTSSEYSAVHEDILDQWLSYRWITDSKLFHRLCDSLQDFCLPKERLYKLMYDLCEKWNRFYCTTSNDHIKLPSQFYSWLCIKKWLFALQERAAKLSDNSKYAADIVHSIMEAAELINKDVSKSLNTADVAKEVNLSRGYFCQCFKDIIRMSFKEYLRHLRTQRACELLEKTDKPIYMIAQMTGYHDEKYFSRVFREQVGILPSEYRHRNDGGRG